MKASYFFNPVLPCSAISFSPLLFLLSALRIIAMQYDKKQLEILIMDYFRSNWPEFPKGKVESTESPDFTISLNNRNKLGIELTRLNPVNRSIITGLPKEQNRINDEIVSLSSEIFSRTSPHKLFVKILFSAKIFIAEERKIQVAVMCANLVAEAVQHSNQLSFFNFIIAGEQLPQGVERILVVNHPALQTPVWERANNLGISTDVVEDIRQAIKKKDEKLSIYHKKQLNLYWLLIISDRLRGVKEFNLPQQIDRHEFHSRFQRVFLFDLMKPDIYQIV